MDADIKKRWVEALRSGKYKQGKAALRSNENHFCCVGVLCDIVAPNDWQLSGSIFNFQGTNHYDLPANFRRDLDIPNAEENKLIYMNDYKNKSFSEIADYIEANL